MMLKYIVILGVGYGGVFFVLIVCKYYIKE